MSRTCNGKPADQVSRELRGFFEEGQIEWKVNRFSRDGTKAIMLAYIDARAIMSRLDRTCGADNWRVQFERWGEHGVLCHLSIRFVTPDVGPCIEDEWVTKTDGADDTDIEATKGGLSSALKRAASMWGIGRYLYAMPTRFCEAETGKNGKPRLKTFGDKPSVPDKFLPNSPLNPDRKDRNDA